MSMYSGLGSSSQDAPATPQYSSRFTPGDMLRDLQPSASEYGIIDRYMRTWFSEQTTGVYSQDPIDRRVLQGYTIDGTQCRYIGPMSGGPALSLNAFAPELPAQYTADLAMRIMPLIRQEILEHRGQKVDSGQLLLPGIDDTLGF